MQTGMYRTTLSQLKLLSLTAILYAAAVITAPSAHAEGQSGQAIAIELNAQKQTGTACQLNFVIKNTLGTAIEDLTFELVLFDTEAQITSIMTARSGNLPNGKTRVKRYALKDKSCKDIGKILINDVKSCKGEALTPGKCLSALSASSRTDSKLEL